jgi:DNA-binding transcriptional LysR family regulator
VTHSEALLPILLADQAAAALPEFIAAQYLRDGRLVSLLPTGNHRAAVCTSCHPPRKTGQKRWR